MCVCVWVCFCVGEEVTWYIWHSWNTGLLGTQWCCGFSHFVSPPLFCSIGYGRVMFFWIDSAFFLLVSMVLQLLTLFQCQSLVKNEIFRFIERWVYWFHIVCLSIRPSVHLSIHMWTKSCLLCISYNTSRIHFIFAHLIKQLQKVCPV